VTTANARRFLAAVIGSLLLHALVLSGSWLRLPVENPPVPPLEARLITAKPLPQAEPAPPPAKPRRTLKRLRPRHSSASTAPQGPKVEAESPFALPPEPEPPAAAPADASAAIGEPPTEALAPEAVPEVAPATSLPRRGRITYTIFLGTDRFGVGRTVQSWEIEGDSYKLGSASETTGVARLFAARHLTYLSEGKITANRLRPQTFLMSRTRRGQLEAARVTFDWNAGRITFGKLPEKREAALPAGSQDIVSFMYQLSLDPPAPGRVRLPVTNGVGFDMYEFDVSDEENIDTPIGTLKALPVKQVRRSGEESIEIWLAPEYRYLPVRLRFIDREGNPSGEQIVSEIKLSQD